MVSRRNEVFYTIDRDLRFTTVSPGSLALWRKTADEVLGRSVLEVFPSVRDGEIHKALLEALRSYRAVRVRTFSLLFGKVVEVEVYPTAEGAQVSFSDVGAAGAGGPGSPGSGSAPPP